MRAVLVAIAVAVIAAPAALGVLLVGRGGTPSEAQATSGALTLPPLRRCTNRDLGYSVAYPATWHALAACTFFDPRLTRVPPNTDVTPALTVTTAQNTPAIVVASIISPPYARLVSRRRTTVARHPATVVEAIATGRGLHERGTRIYAYVVDLGKRPPIVIQTWRAPRASWGLRRWAADTAARTLRLLRPRHPA